MSDWSKGKVVSNTHWTGNLFSLKIDAELAPFKAGQYTNLALDINGRQVVEPYSILSAPDERPLEFFFYTRLEGDLSTSLAALQTGDRIWVQRQPAGQFTLDEVPDADTLWLLATGTGVAPFISMLRTTQPWLRFHQVILVYAARTADDLRYTGFFDTLHSRYPDRFRLVPFISREKVAGSVHGHIPDAIHTGALEQACDRRLTPDDSQVMLCGNPGMIRDAVALLHERGFHDNRPDQPGQLSYESYW